MAYKITVGNESDFRKKMTRVSQTMKVVTDDRRLTEDILKSKEVVRFVTQYIKSIYPRSNEFAFTHRFKPGAKRPSKTRNTHIAAGWSSALATNKDRQKVFAFFHPKYKKDDDVKAAIDVIEGGRKATTVFIPQNKIYRYWNFETNDVAFIKGATRLVIPSRRPASGKNLAQAKKKLTEVMRTKSQEGINKYLREWRNV